MLQDFKPFTTNLMGSMPRTQEVFQAQADLKSGRIDQRQYDQIIHDETLKVVQLQEKVGIDVITGGEYHRDNFISFVAQNVPGVSMFSTEELTEITTGDHQEDFAESLAERDADDHSMNSPAATGKLDVEAEFVLPEMKELREMTKKPLKATVPSPYLLVRNLWVKELSGKYYSGRRDLAKDVVQLVRNEIQRLIDFGVEVIQLDEPILAEVCFASNDAARSFY